MANVSLTGGETGSNIALSGNDALFTVTDGAVHFSTDGGTTQVRFAAGEKVVFSDGDTVTPINNAPVSAAFSHMAF